MSLRLCLVTGTLIVVTNLDALSAPPPTTGLRPLQAEPQSAAALIAMVSERVRQPAATRDETLALARRALELVRISGEEASAAARALELLGMVHSVRGEYLSAIPPLRKACALLETKTVPADSNCLEVLALALISTSQFAEAERVVDRLQALAAATSEVDPLTASRPLGLEALLQRWLGRYDDSKATLERALTLRNGFTRESDDRTMIALLNGDLLWLSADLPGAHRAYQVAAALPHANVREALDHLTAIRRLAFAEAELGNLTSAAELLEVAQREGLELLAPCHNERASQLNDGAGIAFLQADYSAARDLFQQALTHHSRCAALNGEDPVTPIINLASTAEEMGDAQEAQRLYRRADHAWSSRYSRNHPFVALAVDGLARVSTLQQRLELARQHWLRALNIRRQTLGEEHADVAWTLTNLAETELLRNNITAARTLADRSAEIYQRAGVSDRPDRFIRLLSVQSDLALRTGDPVTAEALAAKALDMRLQFFGATHPLSAEAHASLARVQALRGREDVALQSALIAENVARNHLRRSISYLPERQALMYAEVRPEGLNLAVSLAVAGRVSPSAVYDAVVRSRAVVLDELATRSRFKTDSNPGIHKLRDDLTAARQRFANLSLRSLRDRTPVPAPILQNAQQAAEDAERALAELSATFRREQTRGDSGIDDVRRALPADSALVSYLRYEHISSSGSGGSSAQSYAAFVLTPRDGVVAAVPLGLADQIDSRITAWRDAIRLPTSTNEAEYRRVGTRLRERIWDPIVQAVNGASLVFVVPDGPINVVSFGALPVGSRYLIETFEGLHYLSAERDLLNPAGSNPDGGLLAIGGVDFAGRPATSVSARPGTNRSAPCVGALMQFAPLPATNREVTDISAIWTSSSPGRDAVVLRGRAATEEAVKHQASGKSILHLATHGFFLDGQCEPVGRGTRSVGGLVPRRPPELRPSTPAAARPAERRFALAGLALAGASSRPGAGSTADDGIFTAEEIVSLNLQGVDWAVLSACDTGLGRIRAGEGIFGLRRAFQIAGARTVITSLWSVEDEATRLWMRSLYDGRLARGLSTARAVREASVTMLVDRREKGLNTHPFYWASFVAAGSWQ